MAHNAPIDAHGKGSNREMPIRVGIPAPVYGWPKHRRKPKCFLCRLKFPTFADYREHYLKEHHHAATR